MNRREQSFPFIATIGIWLLFVLLAILNGMFRVALIIPIVGNYAGHIISTVILVTVIFVVTWIYVKKQNITSQKHAVQIGSLWLILTAAFEFLFGHFVMKHSWESLLKDYDIFEGRVWILVLAATLLAPIICSSLLKRKYE